MMLYHVRVTFSDGSDCVYTYENQAKAVEIAYYAPLESDAVQVETFVTYLWFNGNFTL